MKKPFRNFFYKDSRLVIKCPTASHLPDGRLVRPVEVNMLTFSPYQTTEVKLKTIRDSVSLTGTYGLNPWDIFNPFKRNMNLVWVMMYQQGLIKDVTAELIHPDYGSVMVTVNNPQIGTPYAVFYNSPIEAVIPSPLVGTKISLDENRGSSWTSDKGWTIEVYRDSDTSNKEFKITI